MNTIISRACGAFALLGLAAAIVSGCSDNPVTPTDDHFEARGVVLRLSGVDTVVADSGRVTGSLVVEAGRETGHISVLFIREDGTRGIPDDEHLTLGWTIADTTIATINSDNPMEPWEFHLRGKKEGTTTLKVHLLHRDHPDFTSPDITITVTP